MTRPKQFANALIAQLPALRRYAMTLAGNVAQADDLVQDCIERALRQSAQLREMPLLSAWLRRILRNLYTDEIRKGRTRGTEQDITELVDAVELSAPPVDTGAARDFIAAVNRLAPEHREILLLVSVEELSYREIAEELKIPIGTVMSRLARARERLRSVLQGEGAEVIPLPVAPKDKT
ncbi:RNA polymerase sigma factor [Niveispirillum sp. SYP-B3756]|uniref:RNA polymerase sigma factor n=1 Tax=Niveispirillum sp. SYP-B3756 TaxID=2662178 RepID=UPI0032B32D30